MSFARRNIRAPADDLAIGTTFLGEDAVALDKAIKDSLKTIKDGPVTFTYQGDRKTHV